LSRVSGPESCADSDGKRSMNAVTMWFVRGAPTRTLGASSQTKPTTTTLDRKSRVN
jgi:hypothetical protein